MGSFIRPAQPVAFIMQRRTWNMGEDAGRPKSRKGKGWNSLAAAHGGSCNGKPASPLQKPHELGKEEEEAGGRRSSRGVLQQLMIAARPARNGGDGKEKGRAENGRNGAGREGSAEGTV